MKRLMWAAAIGIGMMSGPALSKEKVTFGYVLDPALEGVVYAIKKGIVKSDTIEIETTALTIPALIQSTTTKRFDVLMTAVMAIPQAKSRGLDLIVLSTAHRVPDDSADVAIWVKKSSPYKTIADLKGKTIGNFALQSTATVWIRLALQAVHKMNVSLENGDLRWVQIPAPALLTALETDKVDAATLLLSQAFRAQESGEYRMLASPYQDIKKAFGVNAVVSVNVTYPEKLNARPAAFREFNRVLRESALYAMKNTDEVGKAISADAKISPEFFKDWLAKHSVFPAAVSDGDMKAMEVIWRNAKEMGLLTSYPEAKDVVWKDAIRE